MRRNIARTARSLGGTAVSSRPTIGMLASHITSGTPAMGGAEGPAEFHHAADTVEVGCSGAQGEVAAERGGH
jgi:hypothetical protein